MFYLLLFIFLIGYVFIVFEHVNHVDKAATALLMSSVLWAVFALGGDTILSLGYSSAWKEYAQELGDMASVKGREGNRRGKEGKGGVRKGRNEG